MIAIVLGLIVGVAVLGVTVSLVLLRDVASDLAKTEARAWLPLISRRRVRRAAESLPSGSREFLEAWEAELDEVADRPVTMFLVAMRIYRSRRLVAFEARQATLEPNAGTSRRSPIHGILSPVPTVIGFAAQLWSIIHSRIKHPAAYWMLVARRAIAAVIGGFAALLGFAYLRTFELEVQVTWRFLTQDGGGTVIVVILILVVNLVILRGRVRRRR